MAGNEVFVKLTVEEKEAIRGINNLSKKVDDFTKDFQTGMKSSTGAFDVFTGALSANIALEAIKALASAASGLFDTFIGNGIKAAQEQEDAINNLSVALRANGQFTQQAIQDFNDLSSALQGQTKFADDAILNASALIQSLGQLSSEGLQAATISALDLSAALGIDLNSAAQLVGKAAAGEVGSFSRYGLSIKEGANAAETFSNALEALNSRFGGAAAAQVKTFSGSIAQTKNTFGDLLEEIGNVIIKNDTLISIIKLGNDVFKSITQTIVENQDSLRELLATSIQLGAYLVDVVLAVIIKLDQEFQRFKATGNELEILIQDIKIAFAELGLSLIDSTSGIASFFGISKQALEGQKAALQEVINQSETNKLAIEQETAQFLDSYQQREDAVTAFREKLNGAVNVSEEAAPTKEIGDDPVALQAKQNEELIKLQEDYQQKRNALRLLDSDQERLKADRDYEVLSESLGEQNALKEIARIQSIQNDTKREEERQKLLTKGLEADINNQAVLSQLEADVAQKKEEQRLLKNETDALQRDADFAILQETLGTEEALRETARLQSIQNDQKQAEERLKLQAKAVDAQNKQIKAQGTFFDLTEKEKTAAAANTTGLLLQLSKEGNNKNSGVVKSAAIADATMRGYQAVQLALSSAPPPFNFVNAGIITGLTTANVAKISGVSVGNFASGGVIPGNSYFGDKLTANVNSGEMILNQRQQRNLFGAIDGGAVGGTTIINVQGDILADNEQRAMEFMNTIVDLVQNRNASFDLVGA